MKQPLPLSALRAFDAVMRTGSFRAAAADLSLSPSAVSHAICGLEKALGIALFARQGRATRLTEEGATLARYTERGFGELRLGVSSVSAHGGPQLLRLHSAPSFAAQWLLPRLRRLLHEARGIEIRLSAGTDYTRFDKDEFDADIVYGTLPPEFHGGMAGLGAVDTQPLGLETVTPLCRPEDAGVIRVPSDLYRLPLIDSDNKRVRWADWFAINALPAPEPRGLRFDRSFLSIQAALDGLGVALESTRLAERELEQGRLVRPLLGRCEDVTYTGHWLVFPRSKRYWRPLLMFKQWIAAEMDLALAPTPRDAVRMSNSIGMID